MATEILLNDGGAPARILPFEANADLTAGYPVSMDTNGKVGKNGAADSRPLGVALTTVSSGSIASIITGHGVMIKAFTSGSAIIAGDLLATLADGNMDESTTAGNIVAIALEAGDTGGALTKVLWLG